MYTIKIRESGLCRQENPGTVPPMLEEKPTPSRPLCVDMDGTLLESDTMEDLLVSFVRKNFWRAPVLLFWLVKGRAHFKKRLGADVELNVNNLFAHVEFGRFLEQQHATGRQLVLVSAADERVVKQVADRFGIFSGAIGSNGTINLRGHAKLKRLNELYGPKGFDYAGNSSVDYPVWQGAAEAIVVNARHGVEKRAREISNVTHVFPPRPGRPGFWARLVFHHH